MRIPALAGDGPQADLPNFFQRSNWEKLNMSMSLPGHPE
jgi:hypothetical protein